MRRMNDHKRNQENGTSPGTPLTSGHRVIQTQQQEERVVQSEGNMISREDDAHEEEKERTDWDTVKEMMVYVKPHGSVEVNRRIAAAMGLLVGSKVLNVQVPFLFKHTGEMVYMFILIKCML